MCRDGPPCPPRRLRRGRAGCRRAERRVRQRRGGGGRLGGAGRAGLSRCDAASARARACVHGPLAFLPRVPGRAGPDRWSRRWSGQAGQRGPFRPESGSGLPPYCSGSERFNRSPCRPGGQNRTESAALLPSVRIGAPAALLSRGARSQAGSLHAASASSIAAGPVAPAGPFAGEGARRGAAIGPGLGRRRGARRKV
jgi:hypothetical protein